jgi:hypothetical protein
LDEIQNRLYDVSWLFECLGNIFLLFCIVDLGLSFIHVLNSHQRGHNIVRGVTGGLGVILFALNIGRFAKIEALRTDFYNLINFINGDYNSDYSPDDYSFTIPYSVIQLSAAFDIILFIASVAILAFSIYVVVISYQRARLRHVGGSLSPFLLQTNTQPANT